MSNETAPTNVEIVKKKLKKYIHLKEHRKVKEYLRRLRNLSLTPALIQETKLDRLVRKLAANKTASYSSTARHLLQKWHHKRLLLPQSKPVELIPQNQCDEHNLSTSTEMNLNSQESQSSDDNKKRKVLSLAEYLQNKKPALSSSLTLNSSQNQLTDVQIQVINAQFQATTEKLTANACDLASIVNKSLVQAEKPLHHSILKKTNFQESNSKLDDLWAEEEDEDEDDSLNQSQLSQSRTVNNNFHTQKVQ